MSWRETFQSKKAGPEACVELLSSGQRVFVGSGCAEPQGLVHAMMGRAGEVNDIEIVHLLTMGEAPYVDPKVRDSFRHNAWFIGPNVRKAVNEGRADYTPIFLSDVPELITSGRRRIDVAMVTLSPPDRHGYCSLGIHVDVQPAAIHSARVVLAEINPNMPRTFGDTLVHVDQIDLWCENTEPLPELEPEEPDETCVRIGGLVARIIEHGSTLQLGIGQLPNAVLGFLPDKKNLGIHSEMITDGVIPLLENKVITNKNKSFAPGKTVVSFAMGTKKLYDLIHDNPSLVFMPSDVVNDPRVISRNDKVVAVNSALQVDLTGQVVADSIGYGFYSGIGGQVDFIRGASMSKGGKPIIALKSTAEDGRTSRIVPHISEGSGVVTTRGDVHYVVTEYGFAYLHGKTIRERALALINIAHPDFRKELFNEVMRRHYVLGDEAILKGKLDNYPHDLVHHATFGGIELEIRPIQTADERTLQEFFYSHRPETVYARYFSHKRQLGHREASEMCALDYDGRMALGAFQPQGEGERLMGVARYSLNPRTNRAETATVVHEEMRRKHLATYLLQQLEAYARKKGISGFEAEILPENIGMQEVHRKLGHRVFYAPADDVYKVEADFEELDRHHETHDIVASSPSQISKH
jgi:acyl-CoA hydrolase